MNRGILYAALAYTFWGLFPIYFHLMTQVPALEVVMHRTVWSLVFLLGVLLARKHWTWLPALLHAPRVLGAFVLSALLLSSNWLMYVWAVQNGHVLDASLGYFILPLVNVAMGCVLLHERPRRWQWVAVGLASAGVLWLTVQAGHLPWIALFLALTFGCYGLLRKVATLGALEGLALETMVLAPLALVVLGWWAWHGQGVLVQGDMRMMGLLLLAGPLTAIPLLLFAAGARRVPLTTMGILQYISPSLQFALGVWMFNEPFEHARFAGFALIWAALVVYSVEGWWTSRNSASKVLIVPAE
jgi:chloramphenicol-sensitive protein RarD